MSQQTSRKPLVRYVVLCIVALTTMTSRQAGANVSLQNVFSTSTLSPDAARVALVFWAPDTSSINDPNQLINFESLLLSGNANGNEGLFGSQYMETLTQYYNYNTSYLVNSASGNLDIFYVTGTPPVFPSCDQFHSIAAAVQAMEPANTLIVIQESQSQYMTNSCSNLCGYHYWSNPNNTDTEYVALAYPASGGYCSRGSTVYDAISHNLEHEVAEIMTDLVVGSGWDNGSTSGEIGDLCNNVTKQVRLTDTLQPFPESVQIQALWNNAANWGQGACVYARPTGYANFYEGYAGGNNQVWVQQDDQNSAFAWGQPTYRSGVTFASAPSVTSWGPYRYDLFFVDNFGHLGHMYQEPNGSVFSDDWGVPAYGYFQGRPEVISPGWGRVDIFATAYYYGNYIAYRSWDLGTDSGWGWLPYNPPVSIIGDPAAASWGPTEMDVFVLGVDGNLYRASSSSAQENFAANWTTWTNVGSSGASLQGDPDAASWGPGRLDVFLLTANGQGLEHYSVNNGVSVGWDYWPEPPGYPQLVGNPTVVALGDQRLKVIVPTTQGGFVTWLWDNARFSYQNLTLNFTPKYNGSAVVANSNNGVSPLGY